MAVAVLVLPCSCLELWGRSWLVFPGEPPGSTGADGEHIWTPLEVKQMSNTSWAWNVYKIEYW